MNNSLYNINLFVHDTHVDVKIDLNDKLSTVDRYTVEMPKDRDISNIMKAALSKYLAAEISVCGDMEDDDSFITLKTSAFCPNKTVNVLYLISVNLIVDEFMSLPKLRTIHICDANVDIRIPKYTNILGMIHKNSNDLKNVILNRINTPEVVPDLWSNTSLCPNIIKIINCPNANSIDFDLNKVKTIVKLSPDKVADIAIAYYERLGIL